MVPFTTAPSPDFDPSRVEASGPGLERTGNTVNKWAEFNVNTRRAGRAKLNVTCIDADLKPVKQLHVRDNKDGTFFCRYMPERPVKHTIIISYGNVQIPNSPYRVLVSDKLRFLLFSTYVIPNFFRLKNQVIRIKLKFMALPYNLVVL